MPGDPYALLGVEPTASWEEIVASYRRLVRWWHPDGLVDAEPDERARCDEMIRRLNVAYTELRLRRGRAPASEVRGPIAGEPAATRPAAGGRGAGGTDPLSPGR